MHMVLALLAVIAIIAGFVGFVGGVFTILFWALAAVLLFGTWKLWPRKRIESSSGRPVEKDRRP